MPNLLLGPGCLMGVGPTSSTHLQVSVSPEYSHLGALLSVKYYIIVVLIDFPGLIMR